MKKCHYCGKEKETTVIHSHKEGVHDTCRACLAWRLAVLCARLLVRPAILVCAVYGLVRWVFGGLSH